MMLAATAKSVVAWAIGRSACRALSTSAVSSRWHKDQRENRHEYRFGYKDPVKFSGALPRTTNDAEPVRQKEIFRPDNPFRPSEALRGQNDYVDILGHDDLHPSRVHYHVPRWLRGFRHSTHYEALIRKRNSLQDSGYAMAFPRKTDLMNKQLNRYYLWVEKNLNQKRWTNYRGLKYGQAKNPYKTKYPF